MKWEKVEALKPLRERRPVPQKPQSFDKAVLGAKSGKWDLDEYN